MTACFKPLLASSFTVEARKFFFAGCLRLEVGVPTTGAVDPLSNMGNNLVGLPVLVGEFPISVSGPLFGVLFARTSSSVGGGKLARMFLIVSVTFSFGLTTLNGELVAVVTDLVGDFFLGEVLLLLGVVSTGGGLLRFSSLTRKSSLSSDS